MKNLSDYLLDYDEEELDKVEDIEKNDEVAAKGKSHLLSIGIAALAALIILTSSAIVANVISNKKYKEDIRKKIEENQDYVQQYKAEKYSHKETAKEILANKNIGNQNNESVSNNDIVKTDDTLDNNVEENDTLTTKTIDYSNVDIFYQGILNNRNNHSDFALSFQSSDDVKNLLNFTYKFDELYNNVDTTSSIKSQQEFIDIISDYYRSCAKYGIDANLNIIFEENSLSRVKLKEAEDLANNLKNGQGSDYSIALAYYRWCAINVCDGRTNIARKTKNAPLIEILRDQFEQYRYVGNMLEARTKSKNDAMGIEKIDIPYGYKDEEGTEVLYDAFSCPDWGVDNVMSRSEEVSETDLVFVEQGEALFKQVDEAFDRVLGASRNR